MSYEDVCEITFIVFLVTLLIAVVMGLLLLWFPALGSEAFGRTLATSVIIMLSAGFYIAVCDSLFRIKHRTEV